MAIKIELQLYAEGHPYGPKLIGADGIDNPSNI